MRKILSLISLVAISLFFVNIAMADLAVLQMHAPDDSNYGQSLCNQPGFKCIQVKSWQTWNDLFPNEKERDVVMRLNRTNVALKYRDWLVVPRSFNQLNYLALAPFPAIRDTGGKPLLLVNLKVFAFAAYDATGHLVWWGPASGGRPWCDETHKTACTSALGDFSVYRMAGADCYSNTYPVETNGGAPMPYCMFYHQGFAIHGSTLSGFANRSSGCVRLFYDDAKWLQQKFTTVGTPVTVEA